MQRSDNINELAAALAKAQAAIEGAKKESENPHFKRAYADLASVWDAVRAPLTAQGLAIVQFPRTVEQGVEIETVLTHTSGQFMADVLWLPANKFDAQGIGSAITYGRRYALMAVAGVAPVDDDGNAAVATTPMGATAPKLGTAGNSSRALAQARAEIAAETGDVRSTYEVKKAANGAAEKAKAWTDQAIQTLNLSAHTVDSLSAFWSDNNDKIEWLREKAPEQYARLEIAADNARESARAKAAA